jgi:aryl-phospho-beta-D-glucosidase BglC (GH1 family)
MRKLSYLLLFFMGMSLLAACNHQETYADQKDHEREVVNKYLRDSAVNVISEDQFAAQNYTTDVSKNQFVLFASNGVYMQIVRKGCGEKIKDGEQVTVLCRYTERNLSNDTVEVSTLSQLLAPYIDKISVSNNSGTFSGSFTSYGESTLMQVHQLSSTSLPQGWLVPLTFINVGRPANDGDEVAKVRLIVPHDVGHQNATATVTPYLYDITYQRGR